MHRIRAELKGFTKTRHPHNKYADTGGTELVAICCYFTGAQRLDEDEVSPDARRPARRVSCSSIWALKCAT